MEHGSQRHELRVGAFVLVGLALVAWLALRFGDVDRHLGEHYPLTLEVRDASGIREGSPVRLGGLDIGFVSGDPILSGDSTSLSIPILVEEGRRVPKGSSVKVGTSGLMGDTYIRVAPPEVADGLFYESDETVSGDGAKTIDDLADGALETLERAALVFDEIGGAIGNLNELVFKVDEEVLSEGNLRDLRGVLGNLRESSELLVAVAARLDPLLDETSLAIGSVRETAEEAGGAFGEVSEGVREFTRTVAEVDPVVREFDLTLDRLRLTLDGLDGLLRRIDSGDGLASALLHDEALRRDLTSFADKLERHGILFYPREGALLRRRDEASAAPSPRPGTPSASAKPASAKPAPASANGKAPEEGRRWLLPALQGPGSRKASDKP